MSAAGPSLVHVKVHVSGVITGRVENIWTSCVRDFGNAQAWYNPPAERIPEQKTFTRLLPGQINGQIGALRLVSIGAASFVDQLEALDDERHILKFKVISHPLNQNPFPGAFLNSHTVIRMSEVTRNGCTFMEWTCDFDTEPQDYEMMQEVIAHQLERGFQGLEAIFPAFRSPPRAPSLYHAHSGASYYVPQPAPAGLVGTVQDMTPAFSDGSMKGNSYRMHRPSLVHNYAPMDPTLRPAQGDLYGSGGSLASSPPHPHASLAGRPGSGSYNVNWTSGGSASTARTLPTRRSAEETINLSRAPSQPISQTNSQTGSRTAQEALLAEAPLAFQAEQLRAHMEAAQRLQHEDQLHHQQAGDRNRRDAGGSSPHATSGQHAKLPTRDPRGEQSYLRQLQQQHELDLQEARLRQADSQSTFSKHPSGEVDLGLAGNYSSDGGGGVGLRRTSSQQQFDRNFAQRGDSTGALSSAPGNNSAGALGGEPRQRGRSVQPGAPWSSG